MFGPSGAGVRRLVFFVHIVRLVAPVGLAALPFLVEVCYAFVVGVFEAELLGGGALEGCIGLPRG